MTFDSLFSPIRIGSIELRNRIVMSAHGYRLAHDNLPSQRLLAYYEARARGGAALLYTHTLAVYPMRAADEPSYHLSIWHERAPEEHAKMLDVVHSHGAKLFGQIGYGGRQASGEAFLRPVQAPSSVPWSPGGEVPRAMTKEDIKRMVTAFGETAARLKKIGYDGVEIHGAHGYLVAEFLSRASNRRTDEYGGSLENRARFPLEVIASVRDAVGPGYPIGIRLSGDEFANDGIELDEQLMFAGMMADTGSLDYLNISAGAYASKERVVPPMYFPQGVHVNLARAIRDRVTPLPVMTVGRIYDPAYADQILKEGAADLVVMTRALIADPEMPNKAAEEDVESIRRCIGIMDCWRRAHGKGFSISCGVNPEAGRELDHTIRSLASEKKQVAIVGAGPGGIESALRLAQRGHEVTILERSDSLGGQVRIAALAKGRESLGDILEYFEHQIKTKSISLRLNEEATREKILALEPDVVVLATGSRPIMDSEIGNGRTIDIRTSLLCPDRVGPRVLVYTETIGMTGLCVADSFAQSGCAVIVVTPHSKIGSDLDPSTYNMVRQRFASKHIRILTDCRLIGVEGDRATLVNVWTEHAAQGSSTPELQEMEADTVICDWGDESDDALYQELEGSVPKVYRVGDCLTPRGLQAAFWDAAGLAIRV